MTTEIIIPHVGATGGDVRIVAWLVRVGDFVSTGTPLVTIETDKATEDLEAFSDGYVDAITADVGSDVPVGSVIATLRAKQTQAEPEGKAVKSSAPNANHSDQMKTVAASPIGARDRRFGFAPKPVLASPAARRLAREKNIDLASLSVEREGRAI